VTPSPHTTAVAVHPNDSEINSSDDGLASLAVLLTGDRLNIHIHVLGLTSLFLTLSYLDYYNPAPNLNNSFRGVILLQVLSDFILKWGKIEIDQFVDDLAEIQYRQRDD
jgi:hypothetical protein